MRRRGRRGREEEPVNHDRWLVSYADFITLLFAFFTTLYAISVVDADKGKRLVHSIRDSFGYRSFEMGNDDPGVFDTFIGTAIELGADPGGIDQPPGGKAMDRLSKQIQNLTRAQQMEHAVTTQQNQETRPDYLLILPWNIKDEVMKSMSHIRDWGGRFLVPIPSVRVYP